MDFLELARKRYSCRKYLNRKVEPEYLQQILEAARLAPSAANLQPWFFIIIEKEDNLREIKQCYSRSWLDSAPLVIVICGDHTQSWKRDDGKDHCDIDIAIAVDHMTLAATSIGLATCWICKFDADKCATILGLPPDIEPIVILPVGYPADSAILDRHHTQRKSFSAVVKQERWKSD